MLKLSEVVIEGYEKVVEVQDPDNHLHAFIVIHNSSLGPALGGTRIYPYSSTQDALNDGLRLAKAMTYKSAVAENGFGGGKSVIIADPKKNKTEKLLLSFAQAIHSLKGQYIAAEDIGSTTQDMVILRKKTPYVAALPSEKSSGDPSRFTAWGVFKGIEAVCQTLWNTHSLKGKRIAVQGVGSVGSKLADILFWQGAELIISDVDTQKAHDNAILFGAQIVNNEEIFDVECDILAPCALGAVINDKTIPKLKCKAIAGAANNQLQRPQNGLELLRNKILYAPDYIINAGGIINAAAEFELGGYNPKISRDKVNHIYETLLALFKMSEQQNKPTSQVADELAEYKIKYGIGKRQIPISFNF